MKVFPAFAFNFAVLLKFWKNNVNKSTTSNISASNVQLLKMSTGMDNLYATITEVGARVQYQLVRGVVRFVRSANKSQFGPRATLQPSPKRQEVVC